MRNTDVAASASQAFLATVFLLHQSGVMLDAIVSDYTWADNDLWASLAVLAAPWLLIVLVPTCSRWACRFPIRSPMGR